ncbi:hypothetical protein OD350_28650 (plasmid) [Clostridium beijerinckii]|uniref:hypothetical protein n=1 Tax=Clostridium beijerinckii TaxID=1520 RepID=UPI002227539B|nr:hypothetical protein [Clostridium beijerinckii]UYZ39044.1 hypothetical protein OD350_28650 [Clostridium beijerinckii]
MLKNKIKKVEIIKWEFFSITMRVTNVNEETDEINVDTLINSLLVRLNDRAISSYKLVGEELTNTVEKTTGALSGGIFELSDSGAYFFNEIINEDNEIYYEGCGDTYTIYVGNFQVNLKLMGNFEEKPNVEIVARSNECMK